MTMAGSWLMSFVYFAFIGVVVVLLAVVSYRDVRRRKGEYRPYAGGLVPSSGAGGAGGWGHGGSFGGADRADTRPWKN